ncbi:hypothetical protein [Selenomonas sp. KH1T6]|uniref:hypothetical protein n=1 Tax=Selenomonas sp. KH1T6 TaxID=3158784 RepID=UPI0008A7580B|nr:hypothetical protein SAMN05216583_10827 [Selenomonas ruminantium]
MISKRKVLVKLERPQVNLGVERISRVIELDEYGNEIAEYPDLTYGYDFFEPDVEQAIRNYISLQLNVKSDNVDVEKES